MYVDSVFVRIIDDMNCVTKPTTSSRLKQDF